MAHGKNAMDTSIVPYVSNPMSMPSGCGYTHETVVAMIIKRYMDKLNNKPYELIQVENSYNGFQWCLDNDVNILNVSYNIIVGIGIDYTYEKALAQDMKIITSAGNDNKEGETFLATKDNYVTAVAAVDTFGQHFDFSSWGGGHVDIACLGIHKIFDKYKYGTSFASPVATAITACYDIMFYEKYNRYMTMKESYQFYKQRCIDVDETGKDLKTGFGWLKEESLKGGVISLTDYFKDDNGKWFEDDVNYLAEKGLINGYEDGSIKGDNLIKRAEVFHLLAKQQKQIEELKGIVDSIKK